MDKSKPYFCLECNLEFDNWQTKANHVRWVHQDNTKFLEKLKKENPAYVEARYGKLKEETVTCSNIQCTNTVQIRYREKTGKKKKYFCCRSCANSRGPRTDEFKTTLRSKIKHLWDTGHYDNTTALNHLKLPKIFSSKREREIVNHFKSKYVNDEWKSGGHLRTGTANLSRDLYSDKLKVCFEYDGDWHFLDLQGQLQEKQLKDKALEEWCINNGYRLIRIDEREKISIDEIENLVYRKNEPILKIGNRYI